MACGSPPAACSFPLSSPVSQSRRASRVTAAERMVCGSAAASGGIRGFAATVALLLAGQEPRADLFLDLARHLAIALQVVARIVLALADAIALVGIPRAGLLDDALRGAELDDLALAGDPLAVHDLELRLAEGRRHLVLHHLDARHVADDLVAILDGTDAPDVEADRGVELQRVAAGGRLRIAEHHADLHADLVDEDDDGVGALDVAGELAQRLRHQARLQADLHLAHLALDLRLRSQGRDGVHHDDVHRIRADQHVSDLERLLAGIGLRNEQIADVDAELLRIGGVERVLRIDEGRRAAAALHFRDDLQCEGGLAGGLRPEDLDDAAARQAADAQGDIQAERAGGNGLDVEALRGIAKAHHRAFAELLLDLAQCGGERLLAVLFHLAITQEVARRGEFSVRNYPTKPRRQKPVNQGVSLLFAEFL